MTYGEWTNEWEERKSPRGFTYYWLTGSFSGIDEENEDTDKWALNHGYVAVTPIKLDMTDYDLMNYLD
jgi:5'-nucleotidase